MLADNNGDVPPKLPARTKMKARSQDHLNSQFDSTAHPNEDDNRGRFPYTGVEATGNKRTAPVESSKTTTYAELCFPKQDKDKEIPRSHQPIGPRLSLNDREIDDFEQEAKTAHAAYGEDKVNFDNNDFFVHEDPFEGANPFLEEKPQKQQGIDGQSLQDENKSNHQPTEDLFLPMSAHRGLPYASKSLENLTIEDSNEKHSENENGYTFPHANKTPSLPRCFSNPTYGSNLDCIAARKPGQSNSLPRQKSPSNDDEAPMVFDEEDIQVLMGQGYTREEIKKALITADNNFAMARKILRTYHGTRQHQEE